MKLDHCLSSPIHPHTKAAAATHQPATRQPTADDDSYATDPHNTHPSPLATVDPPAVDPSPSAVSLGPIQSAKVKLPKNYLPRFNGRPIKWISFWDSYVSAIHSHHDLSSANKFNYLWSILDGVLFDAIAGLTLSSSNYKQAIEILHKCCGDNKRHKVKTNYISVQSNRLVA